MWAGPGPPSRACAYIELLQNRRPGPGNSRWAVCRGAGRTAAPPLQWPAFYGLAAPPRPAAPGFADVEAGFLFSSELALAETRRAPPPAHRRRRPRRPHRPERRAHAELLQQRLPGTGAPPAAGRAGARMDRAARRRRPGPRLVCGNLDLHEQVEAKLAPGAEAALLLASGWQANAAVLPARCARRRRPGRGPALCRQAQPRQPAPRLPGRRREADPLPPQRPGPPGKPAVGPRRARPRRQAGGALYRHRKRSAWTATGPTWPGWARSPNATTPSSTWTRRTPPACWAPRAPACPAWRRAGWT